MVGFFISSGPAPGSAFLAAFSPLPLTGVLSSGTELFSLASELQIRSAEGKEFSVELSPKQTTGLKGSLSQRIILRNLASGLVLSSEHPEGIAAPKRSLLDSTFRQGVCGPQAPWPKQLGFPPEILQARIEQAELIVSSQTPEHPGNWSMRIRCRP